MKCGNVCFLLFCIIVTFLFFCIILQVPVLNITFYSHGVPNTVHFIGYIFDARPRQIASNPGYAKNGTKVAEFESLVGRISKYNETFFPPKQFVYFERDTFNMSSLYKFDSVPPVVRDVALPRISSWSRTSNIDHESGTSIFVTNVEDRGTLDNMTNGMKYRYMAGLTKSYVDSYVDICKPSMQRAVSCLLAGDLPHDCIYAAVKNMTFLIHTGQVAEEEDVEFIESGVDGFTSSSRITSVWISLFMPYEVQMHILKHNAYISRLKKGLDEKKYNGLFKSLKENGYNEADIMVEYLHNILAMTIQWTILMEELLENASPTYEYLYEHIKKKPTAGFVISSKTKSGELPKDNKAHTHVLHVMKKIMKPYRDDLSIANKVACPHGKKWFQSQENAVVAEGTWIIEQDGNWGFGRGERRCAGEVLTLEVMKAWIQEFQKESFQYIRGERTDTFGFGYKYKSKITV